MASNQPLDITHDKGKHLGEKRSSVLARAPPYCLALACDVMWLVRWAASIQYNAFTVKNYTGQVTTKTVIGGDIQSTGEK